MRIGVDYYPEHWAEERWTEDADLMKKAGVRIVRLAEFTWARLEPSDGEYDFEWLDRAIAIFKERGIDVVLCTPTNCPPLWLYEQYPDMIQTGKDGRKIATGIRGHRCYNHEKLLNKTRDIVSKMTKHYADEKAVIAWQIDNELEANFCMCETCTDKYHKWLKNKYGSLENVNNAYGNNVWSGTYFSWEQIKPPFGSYPQAWLNPAYMLDYHRFSKWDMTEYIKFQLEIIRENCPNIPVTTNTWFCENLPDFYDAFEKLDFVSFDNYPPVRVPDDREALYSHAFHLDFMRGIKKKNFWIMEELSGLTGCWMPMSSTLRPGQLKGYSLQSYAHGADNVLHFRFRTATTGAEMHWHGLIDHHGVPGRRFLEFTELCQEAQKLDKYDGAEFKAEACILYSADNEVSFKIQPQTEGMYYFKQPMLFHRSLTGLGVNTDIVDERNSLNEYKLVIAPAMYITKADISEKIMKYVEAGGVLILTTRSGVKDEHNNCVEEYLPGIYSLITGCHVEEYDPIGQFDGKMKFADGKTYKCREWCDILSLDGASSLAEYIGDEFCYYGGRSAVTGYTYGKGYVYYVGTVSERDFYDALMKMALKKADVAFIEGIPENVEITTRSLCGKDIRFIFNNNQKPQSFMLQGKEINLKPFEMQINEAD